MRTAARRQRSIIGVCLAAIALCACAAWADEPAAPVTLPPLVVPAAQTPQAPPQDIDLEQRVRILEETIRRLNGQYAPGAADPTESGQTPWWPASTSGPGDGADASRRPPTMTGLPLSSGTMLQRIPSESPPSAGQRSGWDNGFFMRSLDNSYVLRITGQIQADLHDYVNDRDQTDISTFLVRRARLGIDAIVFKYFEFRLLPDFGLGRAVIQDAYLNVHYFDEIQIATGKLKEPVSFEELVQDRFVPTAERSLLDQLVPARDEGVLVHGYNLFDHKLDYAVGIFNGSINGDTDTNGFKDFAWRLVVRPLNFEGLPEFLHLLQVGCSGTTGVEVEPMNPLVLHTPAGVPFFSFNSTVQADGLRNRYTPELSYFYGGLGFAAQTYYEIQQVSPSPAQAAKTVITVPFDGYYVMATYLLTGEKRREFSQLLTPLRIFDPAHPFTNPGAWELVARYSFLEVGDDVFAPGKLQLANPATNANRASELTVGFNWYLNTYVRMQFNWEHAWFSSGVPLGGGPAGLLRSQDSIITRMQVIF